MHYKAKFSKTLDKRSTLIFAANSTAQKLSSSKRYYLTPNLWSRNAARFVALLFSKTQSGGILGCALRHCTSEPIDSRRFVEACRAYEMYSRGHAAVVVPMFRALIMIARVDPHGSVALRSEILCMPFFHLFDFFDLSKCSHRFRLQAQKTIDVTDLSWPKTIPYPLLNDPKPAGYAPQKLKLRP